MSTPVWRKSSYSSGEEQSTCVELARLDGSIGIRDSKQPERGHLAVSGRAFGRLVGRVKGGEFA